MSVPKPPVPAAGVRAGTACGLAAIVLWGTTVAVGRSLSSRLGPLPAAASVYTVAAALSLGALLLRPARLRAALASPRLYLAVCGGLFVLYAACLYLALGLAADARQAIEVGTVNYLWPAATVVLSLPLLGVRARWTLVPGVLLAVGGVALVSLPAPDGAASAAAGPGRLLPHAFALVAALTWGLYSNLSRRWAPGSGAGAVPLFLAATALALSPVLLLHPPARTQWSPQALLELGYLGLFPTTLGYALWEKAVRSGNLSRVAAFSYLTPLLSALTAALYLGRQPGPRLWAGCALVVAGAWIGDAAVREGRGRGR